MFDHYMESAVIGMRKPEEGIYRHAIQTLGVKPDEIVFLDDIGINLKAAAKLGIRTIRECTSLDYLERTYLTCLCDRRLSHLITACAQKAGARDGHHAAR